MGATQGALHVSDLLLHLNTQAAGHKGVLTKHAKHACMQVHFLILKNPPKNKFVCQGVELCMYIEVYTYILQP